MSQFPYKTIVTSAEPMGRWEGIIVSGTPKPGTCMEPMVTNPISGRRTYRARGTTYTKDGQEGPVCVLDMDENQGSDMTVAYTSGRWGRLYWPGNGDEMMMLLRFQSGTGTSLTDFIGSDLEIDAASGMLQGIGTVTGSGAHVQVPFLLYENLGVALTADTHVLCKFIGK